MNSRLDNIKQVVEEHLRAARNLYCAQLHSDIALLQEVNDYVAKRKGKELRTLLLLLSAGEHIDQNSIRLAAAMEMLHNASLMHDDVVDEAEGRRGGESVNKRWSNQVAVLCGDYYLAQTMALLGEVHNEDATHIVNRTVIEMSEGELLQQQYIKSGNYQSDIYYDIIYRKTATLMAACCELGNRSMRTFGEHFGMAFQLRDDLMDREEDKLIPTPPEAEMRQELDKHISEALKCISSLPDSKYKNAIKELTEILNYK